MAQVKRSSLGKIEPKKYAKKFLFEANKKYRIGFPLQENGEVRIDSVPYWNKFSDELKFSALVTGTDEQQAEVGRVLGAPTSRYLTTICVYSTDERGVLLQPFSYKLVPFVFSDGVLADLTTINEEFPLSEKDVIISIKENTDVKYQNLSILPTSKDAVFKNEKLFDIITKGALKNSEEKDYYSVVASDMDIDAIFQKLGISSGEQSSPNTPEDDGVVEVDIDIDSIV